MCTKLAAMYSDSVHKILLSTHLKALINDYWDLTTKKYT